jgi:hypothetical protein
MGDRNTKYFHSVSLEREKANRTMRLRREDGEVVQE